MSVFIREFLDRGRAAQQAADRIIADHERVCAEAGQRLAHLFTPPRRPRRMAAKPARLKDAIEIARIKLLAALDVYRRTCAEQVRTLETRLQVGAERRARKEWSIPKRALCVRLTVYSDYIELRFAGNPRPGQQTEYELTVHLPYTSAQESEVSTRKQLHRVLDKIDSHSRYIHETAERIGADVYLADEATMNQTITTSIEAFIAGLRP